MYACEYSLRKYMRVVVIPPLFHQIGSYDQLTGGASLSEKMFAYDRQGKATVGTVVTRCGSEPCVECGETTTTATAITHRTTTEPQLGEQVLCGLTVLSLNRSLTVVMEFVLKMMMKVFENIYWWTNAMNRKNTYHVLIHRGLVTLIWIS